MEMSTTTEIVRFIACTSATKKGADNNRAPDARAFVGRGFHGRRTFEHVRSETKWKSKIYGLTLSGAE